MEEVSYWPLNEPERLQQICLNFCADHLNKILATLEWVASRSGAIEEVYKLHEGVVLPRNLSDNLLRSILRTVENRDGFSDSVLHMFADQNRMQLRHVDLSHTTVTDQSLCILENHPITHLDLSYCTLTMHIILFINKLSESVVSLRLHNEEHVFTVMDYYYYPDEAPTGYHAVLEQDEINYILTCPKLQSLSLKYGRIRAKCLDRIIQTSKSLTLLDLESCSVKISDVKLLHELTNLTSLCIADNLTESEDIFQSLAKLKQLRHLDISCIGDDSVGSVNFDKPDECLRMLATSLPHLTSLDISGTNLAGVEQTEISHRPTKLRYGGGDEAEKIDSPCSIPGLRGYYLDFLGLLNCRDYPSRRAHIPAKKVTGDNDEDQVLLSLKVYAERLNYLSLALNYTFTLFRYGTVYRKHDALLALLTAMEKYPEQNSIQILASASLFHVIRTAPVQDIPVNLKQRAVEDILRAMNRFSDLTVMHNGCLTLWCFDIPEDVMFCYEDLVMTLLKLIQTQHDQGTVRRALQLLNSLACQVDNSEKLMLGNVGVVEALLKHVRHKLDVSECDELLETCWSTLWNVTDETPENCERFLNESGLELFANCMSTFGEASQLLRNMMGLMGNIAEVKFLRPRMMTEQMLNIFMNLLSKYSIDIEISYNTAGVISHMLSDGPQAWTIDSPSRQEVLTEIMSAIESWNLNAKRMINYRSFEPIIKLLDAYETPEVQHWASWALCNLTKVYPDKYCVLLEKEGGLVKLSELLVDPRPYRRVKELATTVLKTHAAFQSGLLSREPAEHMHVDVELVLEEEDLAEDVDEVNDEEVYDEEVNDEDREDEELQDVG